MNTIQTREDYDKAVDELYNETYTELALKTDYSTANKLIKNTFSDVYDKFNYSTAKDYISHLLSQAQTYEQKKELFPSKFWSSYDARVSVGEELINLIKPFREQIRVAQEIENNPIEQTKHFNAVFNFLKYETRTEAQKDWIHPREIVAFIAKTMEDLNSGIFTTDERLNDKKFTHHTDKFSLASLLSDYCTSFLGQENLRLRDTNSFLLDGYQEAFSIFANLISTYIEPFNLNEKQIDYFNQTKKHIHREIEHSKHVIFPEDLVLAAKIQAKRESTNHSTVNTNNSKNSL